MKEASLPESKVDKTYKDALSDLGIDLSVYDNDNFTASLTKDLDDSADFSKSIILSFAIPLAIFLSIAVAYGFINRVWIFPIILFLATLPIAAGSGLIGFSRALRKAVLSLNGLVMKSFNVIEEIREIAKKKNKKLELSEISGFVCFFVILPIVKRWARKKPLGKAFVAILKKAFRKTVAAFDHDQDQPSAPVDGARLAPEGKPVSDKLRMVASQTGKIVNGTVWTIGTICVFLGIAAIGLGVILIAIVSLLGIRLS